MVNLIVLKIVKKSVDSWWKWTKVRFTVIIASVYISENLVAWIIVSFLLSHQFTQFVVICPAFVGQGDRVYSVDVIVFLGEADWCIVSVDASFGVELIDASRSW